MAVTAGLAAKVGVGLAATGVGATGLYLGGEYISNLTSVYDDALIHFLKSDKDHDIVFDVKKDGSSDLADTDVTLSGSDQAVTVSAKVQVSGASTSAFKKGGNAISDQSNEGMEKIKGLGGGSWNWECNFKFTKITGATSTTMDDEYKNRIYANTDKGLFGILKQDVNSYSKESKPLKKEDLKKIKIDFIRQCGYERGATKNKELKSKQTLDTNDLKVEIELEFGDGAGSNASKLVPKDSNKFDYWFNNRYKNTTSA